ncbi:hypothetical protein GA845_03500 [Burkholderia pseudomallei]|nr:hypothetical protein [Burkholderia pseudomallei]
MQSWRCAMTCVKETDCATGIAVRIEIGQTVADRGGRPLYLEVNLYTYVVRVNKTPVFLWITGVYAAGSCTCGAHNRTRSLFARTGFQWATFSGLCGRAELPRLRPHRLHSD